MKTNSIISIRITHLVFLALTFWSCNTEVSETNEKLQFNNPILTGFYPDPSIVRVEEDYYLITSSFAYYPGLPIFHSKDLVNWEQIGSVIDRPDQLDFMGHGISRGLFAPTITFHDGLYYVVCTLIDTGGNFVVTAESPQGPYSEPYFVPEVNGIDPSLFFDDDGKAYIIYNSIPPNNESLYNGHRTLRMYAYDYENMKVMGEEILLINGGTDISMEPVWIEAPHIYKKDGYYYLMAAEGGTGYNHSEVIFRSKNIKGPYDVFEGNPILTQRHLDPARPNPITTTGHADIVETQDGEWWAVFLGCRPYKDNHYNIGRESFLAPVKWENGWPIINPDFEEVQYQYPVPSIHTGKTNNQDSLDHDEFREPWDKRWMFLRNVTEQWYNYDQDNGHLTIQLRPEIIDGVSNPSLIMKRQNHLLGSATTQLEFIPEASNEMAGLVIMQNDNHYFFINKGQEKIQLLKKTENGYEYLNEVPYQDKQVHLKIESLGTTYNFYYSSDGEEFKIIGEGIDATYLSTATAGGFVGSMYGLFASSNGEASENKAIFTYLNREKYKSRE